VDLLGRAEGLEAERARLEELLREADDAAAAAVSPI
jgi:hypothetical protein